MVRDRPAERLALEGELERALERDLHRADGAERHQQPLPLEVGHDQVEAAVLLAEQVLLGHEHVVERDLRRVGGVPAELLERARSHAGAAFDDQEREAVVAALRSVVLTAVTSTSARTPSVMNIFEPLTT